MSNRVTQSAPAETLDKKQNGIFYTPAEATTVLCKWGIRSPNDNVLEPSFGGCEFLRSSRDHLLTLMCPAPKDRLYGCDVDRKAFNYLSQTIGISDTARRFIYQDFLTLKPTDFAVSSFDCVIGNPPYVSYHNMSEGQKTSAIAALEGAGIRLKFKPSLWAFFVIHSLQFLKRGGRFAWILPSSFLHADYASEIRALLQKRFKRSLVVMLGERLFLGEGTEERTIILLCEEFVEEVEGSMEIGFAADLADLNSIITGWERGRWQGKKYEGRPGLALMSENAVAAFGELSTSTSAKKLGDICKIKIGIVTGANDFFVINRTSAATANLPNDVLSYILPKFNYVRGIRLVKKDLQTLKRSNKRCLLVDTSRVNEISGPLKEYLETFPEDKRMSNKTFKKRSIWHRPDDGQVPDAFFPYMHSHGPSILLNGARITCTNTVHRIFFEPSVSLVLRKALTISILSTFSQLSAEIEGRSYGSGILKHEPSEVAKIILQFPPNVNVGTVSEVFDKIDSLLRRGAGAEAQNVADRFVLSGYSKKEQRHYVDLLAQALLMARARRIHSRKENTNPHNS